MRPFNRVGIFAKRNDSRITDTLLLLYNYLRQDYEVFMDESVGDLPNITSISSEEIAHTIDVGIVVGGDGTLLTTGRLLSGFDIPVIGVNLGRVGFLVDISPEQMIAQLTNILNGEYHEEKRFLLHAEVWRDGHLVEASKKTFKAFNDVIMRARDRIRMIEFTIYINGIFVNTQHADGLVIATPTGSTAYALSSGGPILYPAREAITIVPICPHTLTLRPLVVDHHSKIEIKLCSQRAINSRLSLDAHDDIDLLSGDNILVKQSNDKVRLLHPSNYDYYRILRDKLHWGLTL